MTVASRSSHRTTSLVRRRVRSRPLLAVALSAMTAVGLAVIVYFVSTSIAWFATSPTSDPVFGALNHCLMQAIPTQRAGFAVSPDGTFAATWDGTHLALCDASGSAVLEVDIAGVTTAAFDADNALWLATAARTAQGSALWWLTQDDPTPKPAGALGPIALAGHRAGVVALDADGQLVSLNRTGETLGFAKLPRAPRRAQLAVDAAGEIVSVVAEGGLWMFEAGTLSPLRAESPCDVTFLWWQSSPAQALMSCGPGESWALTLHARTSARETAEDRTRVHSVLVPGRGVYVQSCDGLPCQAPPP